MTDRFRHHDALRLFIEVARHSSFSVAARALHSTKGAISYQITTLEKQLGFDLFNRSARGVTLTSKGQRLLTSCTASFAELEREISYLRADQFESLTVGVSSYFAARWLSPRLMSFMHEHPDIQLRIQPMIRLFGLEQQGIDIAIRWGNGDWDDANILTFMSMPAWPAGNSNAAKRVKKIGLEKAINEFRLLRDHDDSNAWTDWFQSTGHKERTHRDNLIIPDPNVRVQAVVDGQGLALMDDLVTSELQSRKLFRLSEASLSTYGYFLAMPKGTTKDSIGKFSSWLLANSHT